MTRLEGLTKGALVRGVLAGRPVKVIDVEWHGSNAVTLTYADDSTASCCTETMSLD